jgi:hypothetical protein
MRRVFPLAVGVGVVAALSISGSLTAQGPAVVLCVRGARDV